MGVFTNNIVSIGDNGTVDKFIVIRICLNKIKTKLWVELAYKRTPKNGTNNVGSKRGTDLYREYFHILADNLIADTENILTIEE